MQIHNIIDAISSKEISNITANYVDVKPGTAFFAIRGTHADGNDYIDQAISNGAALVVTDKDSGAKYNCPILVVQDARIALAEAAYYLYPNHPKYMVAVTGTGGKTSVANYFWQICSLLGYNAASIGTIGVSCSKVELEQFDEILTTPDIVTMYKMMHKMHEHKIEYLAFEASSHGLDQKRLWGIPVSAAAFTNITHEHLDYHGSMTAYREAKLKLFSENLKQDGIAILSTDIENIDDIKAYLVVHGRKYITIGRDGDLNITSCRSTLSKQDVEFIYHGRKYHFTTSISGSFQVSNILVAALLAEGCGINFKDIAYILHKLHSVRGRLERVTSPNHPFHIFVDYAHKPDALEKSLLELTHLKKNRLFVVFGCGGDRDKEKRPIMGGIASKIADIVIITDDNPRTEDRASIRDQIATEAPNAINIGSREDAIKYAIAQLEKDDILLIAGKGHEDYQIIGDKKFPFDDVKIAKRFLY